MTETIENAQATTTTQWMKVARAGAITMVGWAIALNVLAGGIPPVMIFGAMFLAFTPFLRGERPRLALAFAVVTLLLFAGNLPIIVDDASNPESAPVFILNLASILGVALSVIGGFAAFRKAPTRLIPRVARVAAAVFVTGSVLSILMATNTTSEPAQIGDLELVASGVEWSEASLAMDGNGGIWIDNQDGGRHTFAIESEGVEVEIPAFKSRRVELDLAAGTYEFVCTVPGHGSMVGALVVNA